MSCPLGSNDICLSLLNYYNLKIILVHRLLIIKISDYLLVENHWWYNYYVKCYLHFMCNPERLHHDVTKARHTERSRYIHFTMRHSTLNDHKPLSREVTCQVRGVVARLAERGGGVVQLHEHLHVQRQARESVVRVAVQRQPRQRIVPLQHISGNDKTFVNIMLNIMQYHKKVH